MALRVARGLFRVWLVLSVLWIGGVGVVTWRTFPEEWGANDPIVKPRPERGETLPEFDPSKPSFNPDEYLAFKLAEERRSAIWHAGVFALVPPAFVLALGSTLVWAFRGFR